MKISGTVLGIIAIVAGLLILLDRLSLSLVVGIFLVVFGIITLVRR